MKFTIAAGILAAQTLPVVVSDESEHIDFTGGFSAVKKDSFVTDAKGHHRA